MPAADCKLFGTTDFFVDFFLDFLTDFFVDLLDSRASPSCEADEAIYPKKVIIPIVLKMRPESTVPCNTQNPRPRPNLANPVAKCFTAVSTAVAVEKG